MDGSQKPYSFRPRTLIYRKSTDNCRDVVKWEEDRRSPIDERPRKCRKTHSGSKIWSTPSSAPTPVPSEGEMIENLDAGLAGGAEATFLQELSSMETEEAGCGSSPENATDVMDVGVGDPGEIRAATDEFIAEFLGPSYIEDVSDGVVYNLGQQQIGATSSSSNSGSWESQNTDMQTNGYSVGEGKVDSLNVLQEAIDAAEGLVQQERDRMAEDQYSSYTLRERPLFEQLMGMDYEVPDFSLFDYH